MSVTPDKHQRYRGKHHDRIRTRARERYWENWEHNKALSRARGKRIRAARKARVDAMRRQPCTDCRETYPIVAMQLDHVRGTKVATIARFCTGYGNNEQFEDELAKCEVRCANCHAIRHGMTNDDSSDD